MVGALEDPDDVAADAAAMLNGTRYRVEGQGHINAFIKSELVLPRLMAFLAQHAT